MAEHDEALVAAREHLSAGADPSRPLGPLPEGFSATRAALHVVAEHLLKPKRELETGNEIALRFTPGGFGTPVWEDGLTSGGPGQARVEGVELVSVEGPYESRAPVTDLDGGAGLLGIEDPRERIARELTVDAASASALADWFAFGTVVLAELLERHPGGDPEPVRLWPEHFDVGTVMGDEAAGRRANFGASPGDEGHYEPYLYVGPWNQSVGGDVWNATGFVGAELLHSDLLEAEDQLAAAAGFLDRCITALT